MAKLNDQQRALVEQSEAAIEAMVAARVANCPSILQRVTKQDLKQEASLAFCKALLRYRKLRNRHRVKGVGMEICESMRVYAMAAARQAVRFCVSRSFEVREVTSDADVPESVPDPATEEPSVIGRVLSRLKPAEQQVITLVYGLNGTPAMSLRQAAKKLDCNYMKVERMKKRAEANLARYREELIPETSRTRTMTIYKQIRAWRDRQSAPIEKVLLSPATYEAAAAEIGLAPHDSSFSKGFYVDAAKVEAMDSVPDGVLRDAAGVCADATLDAELAAP